MKKVLFSTFSLLCLLSFFSTEAYPQRGMSTGIKSGSMSISSSNIELVKIELNGPQYFEESNIDNILIANLLPGEYSLKVYTNQQRGRNILIINQIIKIMPERRTVINIQSNGKISIRTIMDRNSIVLNPREYDQPPVYQPGYGQELISRIDFNNLIAKLEKTPFAKDRLEILNIASRYNLFYTDQIRGIMRLFPFDDERLSCAKILAPKAYDPQNLYQLADDFSFNSTREKFYEYINQNQRRERY